MFKKSLAASAGFVMALALAEIILRFFAGIIPGVHDYNSNFSEVDSLFELKGFDADSNGIFKIAPETKKDFDARLANLNLSGTSFLYDGKTETDEIYSVLHDMRALQAGKTQDEFSQKYRALRTRPLQELTPLDTAILHFAQHPLNENGFLSIPFTAHGDSAKKVLLLGDSFTWGRTVKHITASFPYLLLANGYVVFNTGISGADVPQYLAVARQYIPALKPDVVVINFYMGNDIAFFPRTLKPYRKIMYRTNAGYLMACPLGVYFESASDAYRFIQRERSIPHTSSFNSFCARTALGTFFWMHLTRLRETEIHHPEHEPYYRQVKALHGEKPYCNAEIDSICRLAQEHGAQCVLAVIRDMAHPEQFAPEMVPGLFENMSYVISPVGREGYSKGDWHYNEKGHLQYAAFLDSLIKSVYAE